MFGILFTYMLAWLHVSAFRIVDRHATFETIAPLDSACVGEQDSPVEAKRDTVNEGPHSTRVQPRRWTAAPGRQICPAMVGPLGDNRFYCRAKEYGSCDRRTGTCHCNIGYKGIDCSECASTHYKIGHRCHPKHLCPTSPTGECSGAGTCNHTTGMCECYSKSAAADCSISHCKEFDTLCVECTNTSCLRCVEGHYLHPDGDSLCHECALDFDPQCVSCNFHSCLKCRSGYNGRRRQFVSTLVNQRLAYYTGGVDEYFPGLEPHHVVRAASLARPLHSRRQRCEQGLSGNSSWQCTAARLQAHHVVCGNSGTIFWSSLTYIAREAGREIRVGVRRTGAGVGPASVSYVLHHLTTQTADLSEGASYTSSRTLYFGAGVTELSFVVTIHDDRIFEGDETAVLELLTPAGGATLGQRRKASITIIDDDLHHASAQHSRWKSRRKIFAGRISQVAILAYSGTGIPLHTGGDTFIVEMNPTFFATRRGLPSAASALKPPYVEESRRVMSSLSDVGNGTYIGGVNATKIGFSTQRAWLVAAGGLRGEYFRNSISQGLLLERIDALMRFSWEDTILQDPIVPQIELMSNINFVRWTGHLRSQRGDTCLLYIDMKGNDLGVRLWFDGRLVINAWRPTGRPRSELSAPVRLTAGHFHSIVLESQMTHTLGERDSGRSIALHWGTSTSRDLVSPGDLF
mmetsp:Transcript_21896/g.67440  ORF Transcript_21896/g.67440 Transcript_21896/m.67440 type:complete len:688 (-) Transcript_21896:4120-6183(-)